MAPVIDVAEPMWMALPMKSAPVGDRVNGAGGLRGRHGLSRRLSAVRSLRPVTY
jgi:hypothetical protein